jgi:hypothetical protein
VNTNLSGADYFFLVVPVALVLFSWISLVLWADLHPNVRHVGRPRGEVTAPGRWRGQGEPESTLAAGAADEHASSQTQGEMAASDQAGATQDKAF